MLTRWTILFLLFIPFLSHAQEYEVVHTLNGHKGAVQNIRFSPDGKLLASCGKTDFQVLIWHIETGGLIRALKGHQDMIYDVTFDATGSLVGTASKDGTVKVWNVKQGKLVGSFENQPVISADHIKYHSVAFVCFSPDSKYVFFGGDNGFLCKGKLGKSSTGAFYRSKRILQTNTHNPRSILSITGGSMTADGKGVMTSIDHFIHITDIKTEKIIKTFYYPFDYINDVVIGPDKNHITAWSYDGKITIWDYHKQQVIKSIQVTAPKNYSTPSFSSDGRYLTSGAFGNSARIWNWQTETAMAKLSAHSKIVRISRFSPSEHLIATASYDGLIKIWKRKIEEEPEILITEQRSKGDIQAKKVISKPSVKMLELFGEKVQKNALIELKNVQFEQSKYDLSAEAKGELQQVAQLLNQHPSMEIEIHGHTDIQGHPIPNYKLSKQRATACMNHLIKLGIAQHRLRVKAFGESKPITAHQSEKKQKNNRRVEIKIIKL